jgi:hypothetical protein
MRRRAVLTAAVVASAAGCGGGSGSSQGSTASNSNQCAATAAAQVVLTPHYRLVLTVGKPEHMFTKAQVQAQHPSSGEMMLAGHMTMTMASGTPMPMLGMRHVEVHICSRATGKVVSAPMPTIVIQRASGARSNLPVAMMEGVDQNPADLHFGNNAQLISRTFTVIVTMNAERGVFHHGPPTTHSQGGETDSQG